MEHGSRPGAAPRAFAGASAPSLTVAAVARRLGVAPATLRTWDRRYGLGPSRHTAGSHRRYTPADVARLLVMRKLTVEGVPPAEAARLACDCAELAAPLQAVPMADGDPSRSADGDPSRSADGDPSRSADGDPSAGASSPPVDDPGFPPPRLAPTGPIDSSDPVTPAGPVDSRPALVVAEQVFAELDARLRAMQLRAVQEAAEAPDASPSVPPSAPSAGVGLLGVARVTDTGESVGESTGPRSGGGRVMPLPGVGPQVRGLARAAMSLDALECQRQLTRSLREDGVHATWEGLVVPVLVAIGRRWQSFGDGIEVEHLFSEVVVSTLRAVTATVREPRNVRPVLLACAPGESHSLPVHALAAALAERQIGVRMLGVGLPAQHLLAAIQRCGPSGVVVHAQLPARDQDVFCGLRRLRPPPRLVASGPGWDGPTLPNYVNRVTSLADALEEAVRSVHFG